MERDSDPRSGARVLFKRFLAERWFGGPDFDSWVRQHPELEAELRALRDEWFAELKEDSPGFLPDSERGARRASSFAPGEVIGGFRLLERLGSGAAGEVWAAEELALGRKVALKLLRPDLVPDPRALERFRREALAGARIQHPGVVAVYSVGRAHGQPYIAQELVEGGRTLAAWILEARARGQPRTSHFEEAVELMIQAADALAAAHALGILHRDVKPQNILLEPDGRAKIADFGLARLAGEDVLSHTGDVMGTFSYMSPSQVHGQNKQLDARTDVFSLGATLYECLTLHRAFPGDSLQEIAHRILYEDPPAPRKVQAGIARDLELICAKALEKHAADRYASMGAFADDLRRFQAGEPILARATSFRGRLRKWTRRHPTSSSILAVSGVALIGILWLTRVNAKESAERRRAEREKLHMSAQWAIQLDDLTSAKALVAEADGLGPPDPTGHLILAAGYARSGRLPQVVEELEFARVRGFEGDPSGLDTALEHAGYGLYLQSRRDVALFPQAERHIRLALQLDPKLYGLELTLYQLRIAVKDVAGARAALESFQSHTPPGEPISRIIEALLQETSGEPRTALDTLEGLRAQPDMDEERLAGLRWYRCAGRLSLRVEELDRAEEYLRRAVAIDATDCGSWEALAVVYQHRMQSGDVGQSTRESAKDCADRAAACNPLLPNPHLVHAYLAHWEFGHEPDTTEAPQSESWKAARHALDVLEALPDGDTSESRVLESSLLVLEARAPLGAQDYGRAADLFERALELDPENMRAAALLGNCDYRLGRPAHGLEATEHALGRWDDPAREGKRDPKVLGALLAWSIGNAARVPDAEAFNRCRDRFALELGRGTRFENEELLNTAEFLATAPVELRDCELAWTVLEEHGVRSAFEATPAAAEARETIRNIESACP